jgi:V/A-type H+-transporting ATPase subunit K|tara:strand:+ start:128 stop:475 length:348 start_codon:yes stop_codon:yes gene_type:complete
LIIQHDIPAKHGKKEEKKMKKNMMKGTSALMVLTSIAMIASVVSAQETTSYNWDAAKLGAGIALGLCGIGTGMSQSQIGAAAVGMVAEGGNFGRALLFTVLPETIVLFGLLAFFL